MVLRRETENFCNSSQFSIHNCTFNFTWCFGRGFYLAKIVHVVHMTCQLIESWHDISSMVPVVSLSLSATHPFHCCQQFPLSHFLLFYRGVVIIFYLSLWHDSYIFFYPLCLSAFVILMLCAIGIIHPHTDTKGGDG